MMSNLILILAAIQLISLNLSVANEETLTNMITDEQDRFTLYKLTLTDVPSSVNAEDYVVDLIGTQFVIIRVINTSIEWRIKLHQNIPSDVILYPEYSLWMKNAEQLKSEWIITVRIPKYYEDGYICNVNDDL